MDVAASDTPPAAAPSGLGPYAQGKFDDPIFSWRDAVSAEQSASRSPRTTLMVARALSSSPADPLATATRKPALSWMDVAKLRVQMDLPPAAAPGAALAAALRTDDPAFQTPPRSPGTPFATPALSPQLSTVRRSINDSRPTSARSNSSSSNAEAAVPPQVTLQSQTHEALQKLARCMA